MRHGRQLSFIVLLAPPYTVTNLALIASDVIQHFNLLSLFISVISVDMFKKVRNRTPGMKYHRCAGASDDKHAVSPGQILPQVSLKSGFHNHFIIKSMTKGFGTSAFGFPACSFYVFKKT